MLLLWVDGLMVGVLLLLVLGGVRGAIGKWLLLLLIVELGICLAGGWGGSISLNVLCGRLLIIITSILIVVGNLKEVFIINIFVIFGAFILVSSENLIMIYLGLEMQNLGLFVLLGRGRGVRGVEGALKFFILGAVSSAVFLLGVAFVYGGSGEVCFLGNNYIGLLENWGRGLITVALLFKLTMVPFHFWAPDVYGGASFYTILLLVTIPKISIFYLLMQVGFEDQIVVWCVALSLLVGGIGGLNQASMKKLFVYSGMINMGMVLWGLLVGGNSGIVISFVYLIIYMIVSIGIFFILLQLKWRSGLIVELVGVGRKNAVLGVSFILLFFTLAGIPPFGIFFVKLWIIMSVLMSGGWLLAVGLVLVSVIAGVFYVRVISIIYENAAWGDRLWGALSKREWLLLFPWVLIGMFAFFTYFYWLVLYWGLVVFDGFLEGLK
uniref:NADH:ubiquinone reductase (H(+)-translocating) n=1 Tax=Hippospongia lachne TaxID=479639 RepID=I6LIQ4_HIPLA|nr:NADH dehydrogenase subunit 2 [Hippospongia lachne]ABW83935.1 NADH dehydrogenase subunit 2 [Hippospongia lachne]